MRYEAVTIRDIAQALGLSTSTVSRALRDSHEISTQTKQRVLEYAQSINYQPNPIAVSLRERKSRSIGIIVSEIANRFFSEIINGVESVAMDRGYNVIIAQSLESAEREKRQIQFLTSRSIDGLLVSVSNATEDTSIFRELNERGLPIVFFDRVVQDIETHKVIVDNRLGSFEATAHLIRKGYRRIALVTNAEGLSITKEREAGYRAALHKHGIAVDDSLIRHSSPGGQAEKEALEIMASLMALNDRPDAIFATSDRLTTGCLRYLKSNQVRIPDEMALIGFSNSEITELLDPPLSIVRQPAFEMGATAIRMLLELIESKRPVTQFRTQVMAAEHMFRQSTQPRDADRNKPL
jgi:LacI family transcriptional regulator